MGSGRGLGGNRPSPLGGVIGRVTAQQGGNSAFWSIARRMSSKSTTPSTASSPAGSASPVTRILFPHVPVRGSQEPGAVIGHPHQMPLAGQMRELGRRLNPPDTDAAAVLGAELGGAVVRHRSSEVHPSRDLPRSGTGERP